MQYYKVQSLNVNVVNNTIKRINIVSKLKREQIDIIDWFIKEHEKWKRMGFKNIHYASHRSGKKEEWPFWYQTRLVLSLLENIKIKREDMFWWKGKWNRKTSHCVIYMHPRVVVQGSLRRYSVWLPQKVYEHVYVQEISIYFSIQNGIQLAGTGGELN